MKLYAVAVLIVLVLASVSASADDPGYLSSSPYSYGAPSLFGQDGTYLGKLSANRYDPDSVSNPYGRYGSQYSPNSINNPYSTYGSKYSPLSPTNPYASHNAPKIYAQDGTYLGKLNANRYDPDSVSNPYGRYGSRYSPSSINNPYGTYGSRYSPLSPKDPYATQPPAIVSESMYPALVPSAGRSSVGSVMDSYLSALGASRASSASALPAARALSGLAESQRSQRQPSALTALQESDKLVGDISWWKTTSSADQASMLRHRNEQRSILGMPLETTLPDLVTPQFERDLATVEKMVESKLMTVDQGADLLISIYGAAWITEHLSLPQETVSKPDSKKNR